MTSARDPRSERQTAWFAAGWPVAVFVPAVALAGWIAVGNGEPLTEVVINIVVYGAFSIVGTWIALRSKNKIGHVFQLLGILAATLFLTQAYTERVFGDADGAIAGGGLAMSALWIKQLLFVPFFCFSFVVPFLLFPTGTASSSRWRVVLWVVWMWMALSALASALGPRLEISDTTIHNPLAVDAVAPIASFVGDHAFTVTALLGLVAVISLIFRYRASGSEQRAQIKWFLFAGMVLIFGLLLDEVILDSLQVDAPALETAIETAALLLGLLGLPVATGIAILKYRLYDIDVIINRTLVYAVLTAVLVAAYALGVLLFRTVLDPLTGDNDVAIAASTLAVAGLFGPARRRIQSFIDRRFYRSRYDAQQTLEAFAARLRDQVELDALSDDLLDVVSETVQPRHASVWLVEEVAR